MNFVLQTLRSIAPPLLLGLPLVALGCQDPVLLPPKDQSSVTAPPPKPAEKSKLPAEAPSSPTASAVRISPEILKACGIKDNDAHFAFDSADLRPGELNALDAVAVCFTTGPLKGRVLRIVGHADPRGSAEYNVALGQSRADAVSTYIVGKGLDRAKAQSSSRGEMDAAGTDEPSWAQDRRVDLFLAP
ncbi:MAG TPA: OmpA family protein [Polyangiaceae bacterium]|nr:OmpA family protein [Polyangiaceae bacterium]